MKKVVSLLAILLAALLTFTGCSGTNADTNTTKAESSAKAESSTKAEPYTVKMAWLILTDQPADLQLVQDEINKISVDKINVKVQLAPIPMASWSAQTNLMMSSGEKLDLTIVYNSGGVFNTNVATGRLLALDDLLKQYGTGITKAISDLSPQYLKPGMVNGKTYGVTQLRDLATTYGLCARKDIADKVGIDPTKKLTISQLEEYLAAVKQQYPDMVPLVPFNVGGSIANGLYSWDTLGDGMGVLSNYGLDDTKVVNLYETPEYESMVNTVHRWYQKGYILPDAVTNTNNCVALVKNGKAFGFLSTMKPGYANQETQQTGYTMETIDMAGPVTNTYQVNNFLWTIPTNSKDPVSSMKFLNLMYTDKDVANLLIWGIEGKHYVKTKENENIITYPDGVTSSNTGWGLNLGWEMGNQFLSYVWKGDPPDLMKQLADFDRNAKASKAMGFVFDSSSVKSQVAAVTNVVNQYKIALEDGQSDPATVLPKFIAALKTNGINDIVSAKQKQLDDFLKANK